MGAGTGGSESTTAGDDHRCIYVHDTSGFEDVRGDQWRCPRESVENEDRCRFHRPPSEREDGDTNEAFLRALDASGRNRFDTRDHRRFYGARFGDLDLEHAVVTAGDNYPIDLRDARFEGSLTLGKAVVELPLWLDRATVDGDVIFHRTRFAEHVSLDGMCCGGDLVFDRATFTRNLDSENATVGGNVDGEGAVFGQYLGFIGTTVRGDFSLHNASVDDSAHLHHVHVCGEADFSGIEASNRFWCFSSTFEGDFEMEKATVGGPALFDGTQFQGTVDYWNTAFEGRVRWKETVFENDIEGNELTTESTAKFLNPKFSGDVDLTGLRAEQGLWVVDPTVGGSRCVLLLVRASIGGGRLDEAVAGTLTYDFTEATVGDVTIGATPKTALSAYRFERTRFDGFDFAAYHEVFDQAGWSLTPFAGDDGEVESSAAEETYLKAKNGAKLVGDATAASEFFRKEMTHRRYGHARRARDRETGATDRLRAGGRWVASYLLNLTTGYGERPWRVVACSVGIIALFAFVYAGTVSVAPYRTPLGYVLLSVESFVALVLGGAAEIQTPTIRLLAQIEGFLGAFFIALFVFTLTRSITR